MYICSILLPFRYHGLHFGTVWLNIVDLQIRLKKEQEEKEHKKKEKDEAHLYTIIKVLIYVSVLVSSKQSESS